MGEAEPRDSRPLSDERLYLTGEISVDEYLTRVDTEARDVAAADLARRERERGVVEPTSDKSSLGDVALGR